MCSIYIAVRCMLFWSCSIILRVPLDWRRNNSNFEGYKSYRKDPMMPFRKYFLPIPLEFLCIVRHSYGILKETKHELQPLVVSYGFPTLCPNTYFIHVGFQVLVHFFLCVPIYNSYKVKPQPAMFYFDTKNV